jgi:hypothetical protein
VSFHREMTNVEKIKQKGLCVFLKVRRRLKNDDKEHPNFALWVQTYDGEYR